MILIIFTGAATGFTMSGRLKTKVRFFEELSIFISQLKIKIRFSGDTVQELLANAGGVYLLKEHLNMTLCLMEQGESFVSAWNTASEKTASVYYLAADDKNLLMQFGIGLGISDVQGQITHLELCSKLIGTRLEIMRSEAGNKMKVYRLLGVLGGVAAAVMLA